MPPSKTEIQIMKLNLTAKTIYNRVSSKTEHRKVANPPKTQTTPSNKDNSKMSIKNRTISYQTKNKSNKVDSPTKIPIKRKIPKTKMNKSNKLKKQN